jgi:hypothetical protein
MMGALDEAGAVVQKRVWRPVQGCRGAGSGCGTGTLAMATHAEQFDAVYAEGAALAFAEAGGAQKMHDACAFC